MIPDKIYFPKDGLPSYIDWDGSPIRTKQVEDSDICYIRKDALMEWLQCAKTVYSQPRELYVINSMIDKLNSM